MTHRTRKKQFYENSDHEDISLSLNKSIIVFVVVDITILSLQSLFEN